MFESSRRQNFDTTLCDKVDLTTNNDHFLTSLVGTRVSIYFVTPLMNFSFKPEAIKAFRNELALYLDNVKPRPKVQVRLREQTSGSCLEITVKFGRKTAYNSYLCSLYETDAKPNEDLTHLPFMCVVHNAHAQVDIWKKVKNFIEKRFMCVIDNCRMADIQMQWLLGVSLKETLRRDSNNGMALTFNLPCSSDVRFVVKWTPQCLLRVWEDCSADETVENIISLKTIVKFVLAMNEHHLNTYGLDISTFILKRVSLLDVDISLEDTLQIFASRAGIFHVILYFLFVECVQNNPHF